MQYCEGGDLATYIKERIVRTTKRMVYHGSFGQPATGFFLTKALVGRKIYIDISNSAVSAKDMRKQRQRIDEQQIMHYFVQILQAQRERTYCGFLQLAWGLA